ncbi:MAG: hypothetical protein U9P49_08060, partial [Thermodesulfobacteriota bacterium]|nr:hypothetical protein [Thermodesulfobacteriota bacterium]
MQRKRIFLYVFIGLVAFFFSSGFLGFCVGPDYVPASIEFTDPPDGQVLDPGTTSVTIHGRVVAGDNEPMSLKAENMSVPFNKATGEFEYEFFLNPDCIYSTCTFQVIDTKGVINKERISFAVGDSYEPGADGVVDDAVRLLLTDGFMDAVEDVASPLIGPMLDDLIELPMVIDLGLLGQIVIDTFDIGEVALQIDIKEGDKIGASIYITPEEVGGTAVFIEGYYDPPGTLLPDVYIAFSADAIIVENA